MTSATIRRTALLAAGLAAILALAGLPSASEGRPVVIKLATITPEGSPWTLMIQKMGQSWAKLSDGQVKLNVYAGGVLGDEPDMVKKMRIGQLHAAGMSTVGVSLIDEGLLCMHLPLMLDGYPELDWVRERMAPKLEADIAKKGFVVLCWTDGGWAHFFSKQPITGLADLRKAKLFVWAGDSHSIDLYNAGGFHPVPLAATDMLPALQTGLIDCFDTPPLAALINQWFGLAPYMLDLKWGPLMGAVVVTKRAWDQVPADLQPKLLAAARDAASDMSRDIRKMGDDAVPAMVKRGLKVTHLTPEAMAQWRQETEAFYPKMSGKMGPPEYTQEVLKLRDEYRAKHKK